MAHRDLKPENILVDKNFDLKIADFGLVSQRKGPSNSFVGTSGYMAPEILTGKPYSGQAADLFSLGVILFILYTGHPPFHEATKKDSFYSFLFNNRAEKFWRAHENIKSRGFFSDSFKQLVTLMLQPEAHNRPGIADIVGH